MNELSAMLFPKRLNKHNEQISFYIYKYTHIKAKCISSKRNAKAHSEKEQTLWVDKHLLLDSIIVYLTI